MTQTIRGRLVVITLGILVLCWLALIPLSMSQTRSQIDILMDHRAEYMADSMMVILEGEAREAGTTGIMPGTAGPGPVHHYESEPPFPFQMWFAGTLRARTVSMPDFGVPDANTPTWQEFSVNGELWRVLTTRKSVPVPRGIAEAYVVVGIRTSELRTLAESLVWRSTWPLFVSLPLLAIIIYLGIGIGLQPLRELAAQVSRRTPKRLRPVSSEHIPGEVIPLVDALNHLFEEVQRAFSNEKRFTADAAHELRTPLSALKAQAQFALRADNDLSKRNSLQKIVTSVDRMTHLVSQLLTLARLDPNVEIEGNQIDLVAVTAEVMAELGSQAVKKEIDISLQSEDTAYVRGDSTLLSVLVRNLLDNACRHTPVGGTISVEIASNGELTELMVADSGPGIPEEFREEVFRRFYRLPEADGFGIGLGLSIVQRIASLHHATIRMPGHDDGPGLVVVVSFPSSREYERRRAA